MKWILQYKYLLITICWNPTNMIRIIKKGERMSACVDW